MKRVTLLVFRGRKIKLLDDRIPEGTRCWVVRFQPRRYMVDVKWFDHNGTLRRTNNVSLEAFTSLTGTGRLRSF